MRRAKLSCAYVIVDDTGWHIINRFFVQSITWTKVTTCVGVQTALTPTASTLHRVSFVENLRSNTGLPLAGFVVVWSKLTYIRYDV